LGVLHEGNHEVLYAHHDIYNSSSPPAEATSIQTFYESQYLEKKKAITYIRFRTNYGRQS
jgi:tRNA (guanine-N7-)-methyltransferase